MSELVLVASDAGVCEVRLNRPEKRNAITFAMYEQLVGALTAAQADAAVRVLLLSGEGASFSAGNDLQDFLSVFGITLDTVKVLIFPRDERMRALISLRAFGLQEIDAVRYYIAMIMAGHGVVSAPNMAIGPP